MVELSKPQVIGGIGLCMMERTFIFSPERAVWCVVWEFVHNDDVFVVLVVWIVYALVSSLNMIFC